MRMTIFFTLTLFGLILLNPSLLYGQTPPPRRVPLPGSSTIPKPPPTSAGLKALPDLQVTEIRYDEAKCTIYVRVANSGLADAGAFAVWLNFVGAPIKGFVNSAGLVRKKDEWLGFTAWNQFYQSEEWPKCLIKNMTMTQAVVDARFQYGGGNINTMKPNTDGLVKPGTPIPYGKKVSEPLIEESNENNNQLVVRKADMKPWP